MSGLFLTSPAKAWEDELLKARRYNKSGGGL